MGLSCVGLGDAGSGSATGTSHTSPCHQSQKLLITEDTIKNKQGLMDVLKKKEREI